jgi:hypothetical protein
MRKNLPGKIPRWLENESWLPTRSSSTIICRRIRVTLPEGRMQDVSKGTIVCEAVWLADPPRGKFISLSYAGRKITAWTNAGGRIKPCYITDGVNRTVQEYFCAALQFSTTHCTVPTLKASHGMSGLGIGTITACSYWYYGVYVPPKLSYALAQGPEMRSYRVWYSSSFSLYALTPIKRCWPHLRKGCRAQFQ